MCKFEQVGVEIQFSCFTKAEANREFRHSCELCCNHGLRIECDRCSIAHTHGQVLAILDDKERRR